MDIRTDIVPPSLTNKVLELVSNLVVQSSIKYALQFSVHERRYWFITCTRNKVQWI